MISARAFVAPSRQCLRGLRTVPTFSQVCSQSNLSLHLNCALLTSFNSYQARGYAAAAGGNRVGAFKGQKGSDVWSPTRVVCRYFRDPSCETEKVD
jgi:isocitrate dehydrogenase (NAD+)